MDDKWVYGRGGGGGGYGGSGCRNHVARADLGGVSKAMRLRKPEKAW